MIVKTDIDFDIFELFKNLHMKDSLFFISQSQKLIAKFVLIETDSFAHRSSLEGLISQSELLLFAWSETMPLLFDIKQIKKRYKGTYFDREAVVAKKIKLLLESFNQYVVDYHLQS